MRVLHLPTSVGGNSWALAEGERALGLDSRVLVATQNKLAYQADINLHLEHARSGVHKLWRLAREFVRQRRQFDVFHFNFGSSLIHAPAVGLNQFELPLYPPGVRLFATYNGCDARQKYPTMARTPIAACHNAGCYGGQCNSGKLDERRRRGIAKMARHAAHLWAVNPDLLYFLPPEKSSFLPYACTVPEPDTIAPVGRARALRIVHAPTNREAKGTEHILRAVEAVARRYPGQVELLLVENLPHAEAVAMYRGADLVVDQVLIGWYGGLAVEVMQMGKPVIARIAEEDLHFLPAAMARDVRETVISADPSTLETALARAVEDRRMLAERAAAGLEYVRRWHSPRAVATVTAAAYERAFDTAAAA